MHKTIIRFIIAAIFIALLILCGCTDNARARSFGGSQTINLKPNQKVVNVSWKTEGSLWVLTRPMKTEESADTLTYQEKSSWGMIEGVVMLVESKQ